MAEEKKKLDELESQKRELTEDELSLAAGGWTIDTNSGGGWSSRQNQGQALDGNKNDFSIQGVNFGYGVQGNRGWLETD